MSDISPIHNAQAASYQPNGRIERPAPAASPQRPGDQLELSETSRLLAKLAGLPEVRQDLVNRVRAEIEAGTYETPGKLDEAIEALAEDLR